MPATGRCFRGHVMRLWLEDELSALFGIDEPLSEATADETYDHVAERLTAPEMRPRALYRRFGLEVLATTDSPLDDLSAHAALRDDPSWEGRVVPTFRPDGLIDHVRGPATGPVPLDRLEPMFRASAPGNYRGYIAALESRRAVFKGLGATATDHGPLSARPSTSASGRRPLSTTGSGRARTTRPIRPLFSAHMLMEMARMSAEDGLVMQLHPGIWRSHDTVALARFGPDLGADFPFATRLHRRLATSAGSLRFGAGFRPVVFTVDETTYSRELAPMASYYPSLWLGAPWWFLDAPDAMARFWGAITETAGFAKSAGFVDDTRAYCSIPARHDLAAPRPLRLPGPSGLLSTACGSTMPPSSPPTSPTASPRPRSTWLRPL